MTKRKEMPETVIWWTHIAAIKSQLEKIRRAVSNHEPKAVIIQTKVLRRNTDDSQSDEQVGERMLICMMISAFLKPCKTKKKQ